MKDELEFFDVKSREKFKATEYEIREKNGRYFAVAPAPSGEHEAWRVVGKDMAMKYEDEIVHISDDSDDE